MSWRLTIRSYYPKNFYLRRSTDATVRLQSFAVNLSKYSKQCNSCNFMFFFVLPHQEYSDSLASVSAKMLSSTAKKGVQALSAVSPKTAAAVERGRANSDSINMDGTNVAAATAAASGRSQQNAIALARVAVTGTNATIHGIGGGSIRRDGGVDVSVAGVGGVGVGGGVREDASAGRVGAESSGDDGGPLHPQQQAMRRMVSHMSESDPYPCVLGIPVKPALFATSKVYVFVCFAVISIKLMYDVISGL